jgi:adenylate cyclase
MNLASRLESYTVGGQILISDGTRKAVGEDLMLGSCLHVEPKGVRAPLAVYEVLGMGGTHGVVLPTAEDRLELLSDAVACEYFVLEEKIVGRTTFRGSITHLARSGAQLQAEAPLPLLANLKLRLRDNAGELYAKVVDRSAESPLHVRVRFTSISPASRTFIEENLGNLVTAPA